MPFPKHKKLKSFLIFIHNKYNLNFKCLHFQSWENQNSSYKVIKVNNKIKSPSIPALAICLTNTTCNIIYCRVTHHTIIAKHKQIE